VIIKQLLPEIRKLTIGFLLCDITAFVIYGLIAGFTAAFLWGLLIGTAAMIINFTVMGYVSFRATERSARSAKRRMRLSYILRLIFLGGLLFLCYLAPGIDFIGFFITPFFLLVIYAGEAVIKLIKKEG
jgi:amino acid transporter